MNKKFSTLVAGLLLATSLPVAAQYCPTDGEIPYRSTLVKSAVIDPGLEAVREIVPGYQYQLRALPTLINGVGEINEVDEQSTRSNGLIGSVIEKLSEQEVLVVERDYSTGKLYLATSKVEDAVLTHSLWEIKTSPSEVNGRYYSFVNKETGYELTFDHYNSLQKKNGKISYEENDWWNPEGNALMDGCNKWWDLYTTDAEDDLGGLGYSNVYSYFHNADSIMYLARASKVVKADLSGLMDELGEGLTDLVVTVKDAKEKAGDLGKYGIFEGLFIKPVVAGAKVLNAAEINSMIDADGSYLTFDPHIANYYPFGVEAINPENGAGKTKFTVLKPGTNKELNLAVNPLSGWFVAENSPYYTNMNRENYGESAYPSQGEPHLYAGYDVLLRQKDSEKIGNKDCYKYLTVSEKMYDGVETGNYTGLKVEEQMYAYLDEASRIYMPKAEPRDEDVNCPDALEARYHWKITYYPTQDSLVFEPLNASRMSQEEYAKGLAFEETHLASAWTNAYFNTINEGKAYDKAYTGEESGEANDYNNMYNKAAGVPVALYAMNFSAVGDDSALLTVSAAGADLEAALEKYQANCKFEAGYKQNNPAYVTNTASVLRDHEMYADYQAAMRLRVKFNNDYKYLTRTSVPAGLYHITLATGKGGNTTLTEKRANGSYLVDDMAGHLVYDVLEVGQQDFTHMPATQWVVEQLRCDATTGLNKNEAPVVKITNREFGNEAFIGQLYDAGDGKYYFINHEDYARDPNKEEVSNFHLKEKFTCADTIKFEKIADNHLGYLNIEEDSLRENVYQFEHIYDMGVGLALGTDESNILKLMENSKGFELFRVQIPFFEEETKSVFDETTGGTKLEPTGTYSATLVDSLAYGVTTAEVPTQLYKTYYKLKVKDTNLIDNDHLFLAIDNQHKYVIAKESEISKGNGLSFAVFTIKENNCINGEHFYSLVNAPVYACTEPDAPQVVTGLTEGMDNGDPVMVDKNGKVIYRLHDVQNLTGKLAIEAVSRDAKIDDLCSTSTDVFAVTIINRPLYTTLPTDYVNNLDKMLALRTIDEQGNEYLYEDSHSAKAQRWNMNYLGVENRTENGNEGFYVDFVAASEGSRMPQYLFAVAADSVPAYRWCNELLPSGQPKHGVNPSCHHDEEYAGYVEGRFLVNFTDSVNAALIDKQTNADKFKSDGYTRLGFKTAVHRGDSLFILNEGKNLNDYKVASEDPAENGRLYLKPTFFSADSAGLDKVWTAVELDGKHNNVAFSLRNTGDVEQSVMIESNLDGVSKIGSFAGAWIKIINNVPVLAKYINDNGNHNTGDGTDAWKDAEDITSVPNNGEFINQGARFLFTAIDKNADATANEEIAASDVTVVATTGAIIVKGAAGKVVTVANILGQTIANQVAASDNITIAAPAGVAVVTVDGEATKVVVK